MAYNLIQIDTRNNLNVLISGATAIATLVTEPPVAGIVDYDGNVYTTITIGDKIYLKEPLRSTHNWLGESIANYNPNNDVNNVPMYGKLYYGDVLSGTGTRSLAPVGYHVMSRSDWQHLLSGYTTSSSAGIHYLLAGGDMKATGTTYWTTPNTNANDKYGFRETAAGFFNGGYSNINNFNWTWSTTTITGDAAYVYQFSYNNDEIYEPNTGFNKHDFAFGCVRMCKD